MEWLKALVLGIIQGLTEFLPVSSSGHIELGQALLNQNLENDLAFSVFVHLATVLSTIVVFRKDIAFLIKDLLKFQWNESSKFVAYIFVSMIPVFIVGVFFKEEVEALFSNNILLVGFMLLVTALLLLSTTWVKPKDKKLSFLSALLIGMAQALAVIPGISRSGATIATALNLGIDREQAARFSFLMVLLPIIGASVLEIKDISEVGISSNQYGLLACGFIGAFISGLLACSWMLRIVKKGKIQYFAYYCIIIGLLAIILTWIN